MFLAPEQMLLLLPLNYRNGLQIWRKEVSGLMGWKRIQIINGDVIGIAAKVGYEKYDTVTCNPPYFPAHEASEKNLSEHLAIARHEIRLTLEQAIMSASELLKQGGKAAFVHRPGRLLDIVTAMRANRLEPKRIQFIYPKEGKEANTLLIEAIKTVSQI